MKCPKCGAEKECLRYNQFYSDVHNAEVGERKAFFRSHRSKPLGGRLNCVACGTSFYAHLTQDKEIVVDEEAGSLEGTDPFSYELREATPKSMGEYADKRKGE